jgi:hypothetical protein
MSQIFYIQTKSIDGKQYINWNGSSARLAMEDINCDGLDQIGSLLTENCRQITAENENIIVTENTI